MTSPGWLDRIPATVQVEGVDQTPAGTLNFVGVTSTNTGGVLTVTAGAGDELTSATFSWAPTASPDVSAPSEFKSTATANATPVSLVTDTTHADQTQCRYEAEVDARDEFGNAYAATVRAVYERTEGTLRLVTGPTVTTIVNEIGCAATIDNPSGNLIRVKGTGVAATDILWATILDRRTIALAAVAAVFDIDALAWNLAHRGDYAGSPWTGVTTLGSSASYSLVPALDAPDVGAAQNGYDPADFDGVGEEFKAIEAGPTDIHWDDIISTTAYYGFAVVNLRTTAAPAANVYDNAQLMADNGGGIGVAFSSSGVKAYHSDSGGLKQTGWAAMSTAAYHLVEWWYDGTDLHIAVDGVEGTSVTAGTTDPLGALTVCVGRDYAATTFADMLLLELRVAPTDLTLTSGFRADVLAYVETQYGLSL
jgi:hypothetical protein